MSFVDGLSVTALVDEADEEDESRRNGRTELRAPAGIRRRSRRELAAIAAAAEQGHRPAVPAVLRGRGDEAEAQGEQARDRARSTSDSSQCDARNGAQDCVSSCRRGASHGDRARARTSTTGSRRNQRSKHTSAHRRWPALTRPARWPATRRSTASGRRYAARRRRRGKQRVADVVAQLAPEPGVERYAEAHLRPAIDFGGNHIGERVAQDGLGGPPRSLKSSGSEAAYSMSARSRNGARASIEFAIVSGRS